MKVILAQPRGFCAGVVRAIEIVERALQKYGPPVYVRHEIVHNKHVVESLKAKGARFVEDLSEVPPNAVTIFSAHGVAKSVEEEAAARDLPVLNATCPLVTKVHNQGKRYVGQGRKLILIGHAGHPEVEGTMGQIAEPVTLVQTESDVAELDIPGRHAGRLCHPDHAVASTTPAASSPRCITRFTDIVGPETRDICYATQNRQTAVRELSKLVDVILVVGAKNSSNSNRLREIGEEVGTPSYLIADGSELQSGLVPRRRDRRHHRRRLGAGSAGGGRDRRAAAARPGRCQPAARPPRDHRVPPAAGIDRRRHRRPRDRESLERQSIARSSRQQRQTCKEDHGFGCISATEGEGRRLCGAGSIWRAASAIRWC